MCTCSGVLFSWQLCIYVYTCLGQWQCMPLPLWQSGRACAWQVRGPGLQMAPERGPPEGNSVSTCVELWSQEGSAVCIYVWYGGYIYESDSSPPKWMGGRKLSLTVLDPQYVVQQLLGIVRNLMVLAVAGVQGQTVLWQGRMRQSDTEQAVYVLALGSDHFIIWGGGWKSCFQQIIFSPDV